MMGGFPSIFLKFANKLAEYFFNKYSANLLCQYFKKTEVFFKFANKLAEYFFNKYSANLLCQYLKKSGRENLGDGTPGGSLRPPPGRTLRRRGEVFLNLQINQNNI